MGLWKKFKDRNKQRVKNNYENAISLYSQKEQELIRKGRDIKLTGKSLKQLIEENPDNEIIPLTEPGTLYKFWITGNPVGKTLKHSLIPYDSRTLGMRSYRGDVKNWLEIGRLGADMLCSCISLPESLSDASGMTTILSGVPVKVKNPSQLLEKLEKEEKGKTKNPLKKLYLAMGLSLLLMLGSAGRYMLKVNRLDKENKDLITEIRKIEESIKVKSLDRTIDEQQKKLTELKETPKYQKYLRQNNEYFKSMNNGMLLGVVSYAIYGVGSIINYSISTKKKKRESSNPKV